MWARHRANEHDIAHAGAEVMKRHRTDAQEGNTEMEMLRCVPTERMLLSSEQNQRDKLTT